MIRIENALDSLRSGAEWVVRGTEIEWLDKEQTQPSDVEIQAEIVRLQKEYDNNKYQRARLKEYPSIEECVHAILDGELDALQAKRKIVKERHPKGGN